MRRSKYGMIEEARERNARRGRRGAEVQRNDRLAAALERADHLKVELRTSASFLVFELATRNPRTGQMHDFELRHEVGDGVDRFAVWMDGERWRNGWSRSRFCAWLFRQIDGVRDDWND